MRLTIGILLTALILYLGGSSIVAARAAPVTRTWHGVGNAQSITFSLPSGPLPGVLVKPWVFRYHFTCHDLGKPIGTSPPWYSFTTFAFNLTGSGPLGDNSGMDSSSNLGRATWSKRFANGGSFTLGITARPTCAWTVTATDLR
ncbi:MAG TPA: hypothetical protein VFB58_10620 [Chloroflexota bacterium]|nr:hypothetical protein [Chloroflexota bacterium]